tara:strand:+ start:1317 stop:1571 length:255 start_codon:yes stop_codon:yes gene_type:complete
MKIKMKNTVQGSANDNGSVSMEYQAGVEYDMSEAWQMKIATIFLNNGSAGKLLNETAKKVVNDMETKVEKKEKNIFKKVFGKKK